MRATGIVRRLDDLGRIVIPKEIRRTLNVREGDAMEIWVDDEHKGIVLTKYNCDENAVTLLKQAAQMLEGSENAAYRDLIFHIASKLAE
jgi:stage V sporulation protein T